MHRSQVDVGKLLHDLRNPVAAIYTAVTIVKELPDSTTLDSIRRHLALIEQAIAESETLMQRAQDEWDEVGPSAP